MLRNLYLLSILLTVGVVSWIGFNVFLNMTQSTIPEDTSTQIVPITPTFDLQTMQDLELRSRVDVNLSDDSPLPAQGSAPLPEDEEEPSPENPSVTPSPTATPPEEEDIDITISPTPSSGNLPQGNEGDGTQ